MGAGSIVSTSTTCKASRYTAEVVSLTYFKLAGTIVSAPATCKASRFKVMHYHALFFCQMMIALQRRAVL